MIPLQAKVALLVVVVVGSFIMGWKVNSAFAAKREMAINEAKQEFMKAYHTAEANKANVLENRLQELKANERIIERERIKIVDRPVYFNECLDADGLQIIERARTGKAHPSEPTN
tara:strand:- start:2341 stop:2685 length:345 start_codon:yes stop_codon:yes gene_type:complete